MQPTNRSIFPRIALVAGLTLLCTQRTVSAADCATERSGVVTATEYHARQVMDQGLCPVVTDFELIQTSEGPFGCNYIQWTTATFGVITPEFVPGIQVRFLYEVGDCTGEIFADGEVTVKIAQAYLDAHTTGFLISSDQQTPSGDGVTWIVESLGAVPPLSFEGTVTPSGTGYKVDVTFSTSTEVTPAGAISDLIDFIGGAEALDGGVENALLSSLEAALDSLEAGNIQAAEGQLNALINKVQAVRSKKIFDEVADQIIAAATEILELL